MRASRTNVSWGDHAPIFFTLFLYHRTRDLWSQFYWYNENRRKLLLTSKCFIVIYRFTNEHFFSWCFINSPHSDFSPSTDKKPYKIILDISIWRLNSAVQLSTHTSSKCVCFIWTNFLLPHYIPEICNTMYKYKPWKRFGFVLLGLQNCVFSEALIPSGCAYTLSKPPHCIAAMSRSKPRCSILGDVEKTTTQKAMGCEWVIPLIDLCK